MEATMLLWSLTQDIADIFNLPFNSCKPSWTNARHFVTYTSPIALICSPTADNDIVVAAEELRYAAQAIGKITGRIDVEDILDVIFRDFCIGK